MGASVRRGSRVPVAILLTSALALVLSGSAYGASAGNLVVKIEVVGGGSPNGLIVCAQGAKRVREGSITPDGKKCNVVRKRKARLKPLAGSYFIRVYGGLGGGPCYSRKGDGFKLSSCSRVRVKVGATKRIKWHMPSFG